MIQQQKATCCGDVIQAVVYILLMLGGGGVPAAKAQDLQVRATASTDTIGPEDQFQLTILVSGRDSGDAELPRLRFPDFQIVSGPNTSTQFQWVNGVSSSTKSFDYILLPRNEGDFTIDPIEVMVRGKNYRATPVHIRVTAGGPRRRAPAPAQRSDPFAEDPGSEQLTSADVFVEAELDHPWVYAGQQVNLAYRLFTRVGVSGLQLQNSPPLNGFWVEDLEVQPDPAGTRVTVNGREYLEYVVKKQALFPTATGRLSIAPSTFAISVNAPGNWFGFFTRSESVYRKSKPVTLEVRPLPVEGKPAGFGNAVGSFNLTASVDKARAVTGEAVSLRVRLEGRGNLKMIPDITLPPLTDFTVYSSKRADNVRPFEGGVIGGDKTWDYVIVPKAPGNQAIPPLSFSYFDAQRQRYETITTSVLSLTVVRGADVTAAVGTTLSGFLKQDLKRQGTDINFIKLSAGRLGSEGMPLYRSVWFYVAAAMPILFNLGVLLYRRERFRQSVNPMLARSRKARRLACQRLKDALQAGRREPRRFYDEAAEALSGYLSDRFNLPGISVTADTLERALAERAVPQQAIRETIACLQECDFGRFVSASPSGEKMQKIAENIRRVVDSLERAS
jgi:hypothetical protein